MKTGILLTGGAGFIGSHTYLECKEYINKNFLDYEIIVVDNLTNSDLSNLNALENYFEKKVIFYETDIIDYMSLKTIFLKHNIKHVIHFAGLKSVGESTENPLKYFSNNITSTLILLQVMKDSDCKNIIFSSSATVYGIPKKLPITEEENMSILNPYGRTKLMIEEILIDIFNNTKDINVIILRYFNPISCHPTGILKENPSGRPNNLFPIISRVYQGLYDKIAVFGKDYLTHDGTGIRDYIHVVDLAKAHIYALHFLINNNEPVLKIYNVGNGKGYSVLDVINMFEKIGNKKINYYFTDRREGDAPICFANADKIKTELGWSSIYDLEDMVKHEIDRINRG
jgi:UDP-glucose 4-epimerase